MLLELKPNYGIGTIGVKVCANTRGDGFVSSDNMELLNVSTNTGCDVFVPSGTMNSCSMYSLTRDMLGLCLLVTRSCSIDSANTAKL